MCLYVTERGGGRGRGDGRRAWLPEYNLNTTRIRVVSAFVFTLLGFLFLFCYIFHAPAQKIHKLFSSCLLLVFFLCVRSIAAPAIKLRPFCLDFVFYAHILRHMARAEHSPAPAVSLYMALALRLNDFFFTFFV